MQSSTLLSPDCRTASAASGPLPAICFRDPREVLADDSLDPTAKREILSSWASDAWAPESMPTLRWPPGAPAAVPVRSLIEALQHLDRLGEQA
jgi:hypothetical protein